MSITLDGSLGITSPSATVPNTFNSSSTFGFKSRIINGNMAIDQRNAGASVTPTVSTYTLDRYKLEISQASKLSVQQNAGAVTPPAGFTNYLGITSTSSYSVTAGDFFLLCQRIEGFNVSDLGWGTANAQTVTLSFKVRSSLTGTFGGVFTNSDQNRSYPFTYSIPTANTWTTISVTVAGDTSGTWLTNNGVGVFVYFGLGVGSTYGSGTAGAWAAGNIFAPSGCVSVVGTNGATFYITAVQLELGSTATSFDYRPYGTELALCQRYYEKSYDIGVVPATATNAGSCGSSGLQGVTSTTEVGQRTNFSVTKRATPTILVWDANGNSNKVDRIQAGVTNNYNSTFSGTNNVGTNGFNAYSGSGATCSSILYHYTASAEL